MLSSSASSSEKKHLKNAAEKKISLEMPDQIEKNNAKGETKTENLKVGVHSLACLLYVKFIFLCYRIGETRHVTASASS